MINHLNKVYVREKGRACFGDRDKEQELLVTVALVWAIQKQYKALLYDGNHV